jgi:SecD/SecF fusion protein
MQRNFLRGLLICLLPCALFGAFAAFGQYRKGIDLAGGTILVYEVDLEKAQRRQQLEEGQNIPLENRAFDADAPRQGLSAEKMQQLAESLKRRIDPADLRNVIIRPLGDSRIEIILPFSPAKKAGEAQQEGITEDFVQFVKNVVSQVGVLEFRILANETDDAAAIADAEQLVNAMTPEEAARLAKAGQPPPAPTGQYKVTINDVEAEDVTYAWVELSKEERESMALSNAAKDDPARNALWRRLAEQRGKTFRYQTGGEGKQGSMLLFSREVQHEQFLAEEEAEIRRR